MKKTASAVSVEVKESDFVLRSVTASSRGDEIA